MAPLAAALLLLVGCAVADARDLAGVYEDALQADPQLRQAEANRLAAREARPQAWASLLPQVSASASIARTHSAGTEDQFVGTQGGGASIVPVPARVDTTTRAWSLNLRQSVFSWTNWMSLRQASSEVAQAEANWQAATQQLIQRVAQAYFNVLAALDALDAQQASLTAISRQLEQADRRFEVGLIPITDVEEARAARDTAAAAVIAAKRSLATAQDQLEEITGRRYEALARPGADMPLLTPEPASQDRWVQIALEQNLSLIASRLAADIARENVHIAFGGHLPSIDLVARRGFSRSNTDEVIDAVPYDNVIARANDRQYSLQLSVPLFSGGYTQSKVRQAQYQWLAAREAVVQGSRATERQARDAYLGVIAGIARVRALRQALESSEVALKATEAGYGAGTRTAVDVLNARRLLVQAQTDHASSRYDYLLSIVALRLAAGNLDRGEVLALNGWLTSGVDTPQPRLTPESLTPAETGGQSGPPAAR